VYPRTSTIRLQLPPQQAEYLYWELLGLLDHYQQHLTPQLEPQEEAALRSAAVQLEAGLKRAEAIAEHQLQQLRAITNRDRSA
jgi:hypothetical protein